MQLNLYQVDAFTDRIFGGNPAAVVPLQEWLPEPTMQAIALENNLSETAFFVPRDDGDFDLRWFTPLIEVDLCGHATLGTAWVLFNRLGHAGNSITFHTRSGPLTVSSDGDRLTMDFPAQPPAVAEIGNVADALGVEPVAVLAAPYAMAVLDDVVDQFKRVGLKVTQEFAQSGNALGLGQRRGMTPPGHGHQAGIGILPAHPREAFLGQHVRDPRFPCSQPLMVSTLS